MSLKICSLASGSKGNCCFVSDGHTDILIDLGISTARAEKCLRVLGCDPDAISVCVTHSHSDHIGGLKTYNKKHPSVKVFCQRESEYAIKRSAGVTPEVAPREFNIGTLTVTAIEALHDVPCFGYIISDGNKRVSVMTDVGMLSEKQLVALSACDIVMLESNHDRDMLRANPTYTPMLKARIASSHGHLSNAACADACAFLAANGVRNFILAHLSEENNTQQLALDEVKKALDKTGVDGVRVVAATQNEMTGLFVVC
ncbi:MAG: MBL fold metallo-hydrolase [Clostridiales bacterium]|nr:MBL fold metallo-hydrolase [Clostridiales bacterium]